MSRLLAELRRRNVVRVAIAYVALGWLVLQSADVLLGVAGIPDEGLRFVFVLLVIGFPIALLLSWVYELTPEGIKRESEVDRSQSITAHTGRRLDYVIVGALVVAVLVFAFDRWDTRRMAGQEMATAEVPGQTRASTAAEAARPSIAVLPFASLSGEPDNEYFADGLAEEMLTRLSQLGELRVVGRTSSFAFKGQQLDPRTIAEKLGVRHLLEGSVRRSGDRVRIAAQLLDGETGASLWSESYDRRLSDIFQIQSSIALAVVEQLRVELLGLEADLLTQAGTDDPEAYQLYLSAQSHLAERTRAATLEAERLFARAVELDPDYALALAGLADAYMLGAHNHAIRLYDESSELAEPLLERAVQLAPNSAKVHASLGLLYSHKSATAADPQFYEERSRAEFERAIALNPDLPEAYYWYSSLLVETGPDYEAATALLEKALELDPLARVPMNNLGTYFLSLGRLDEAREHLEKAIELFPDYAAPYLNLSAVESADGEFITSMEVIERALARTTGAESQVFPVLMGMALMLRQPDIAAEYLERIPQDSVMQRLMGRAALLEYAQDYDGLITLIEGAMAAFDTPPVEMQRWAAYANWRAGNTDAAEAQVRELLPGLFVDGPPVVEDRAPGPSASVGLAMLDTEGAERGRKILEAVLRSIEDRPRFGPGGIGLLDARVLAALGRSEEALAILEEAYAAGWLFMALGVSESFHLDGDPFFATLADEPGFLRLNERLEARLAELADRIDERGWPGLASETTAAAVEDASGS